MKNQRNKFPLEPKVNWWRLPEEVEALVKIVDDIETGGVGSQDLQEVTDEGNSTTNNIELLDTSKILFDNGSRLQKGTTNSYTGGNGGIAQICSIDYELKWEAGRQYVMQQDGFTIREVKYNFTLTPGANDDITRGFVSDSRWILDNGDIYLCTDNTEGAAVWELSYSSGVVRFSPVFQATGLTFTGTAVNYPTYNSYYTRFGQMVSFNIIIDLSTVTNFGTGQFKVELPFLPIPTAANHFPAWAWVNPALPPDELNGHIQMVADHLPNSLVLDLHWLKETTATPKPLIESLLVQGTPVTFTTASKIYINGTYICAP
jgi:hypothetical protein